MHEFTPDQNVEPFSFGDTLPGDFLAIEIGILCPDETALYHPGGGGSLAVADGVIEMGRGFGFPPDEYLGDDPAGIKRDLKKKWTTLLDREFGRLLLAHGLPVVENAKLRLREFAAS